MKTENTTLVVNHVFIDEDAAWAHITDRGRKCYINLAPGFVREHVGRTSKDLYSSLRDELRRCGLDITKKPHIEDAFPATRYLWEEVAGSESSMCFIGTDDEDVWGELGLTKREFERQVDADIISYGLDDVIVKYEDGNLYTCYGDLQERFTEAAEQE